MATIDDVAALALSFPETVETESRRGRAWAVAGKVFVWERPYSKADLKRFGDETPPSEPIAAVAVDDLEEKEAILAEGSPGIFTIEHFNGFPALLIELDVVDSGRLQDAIEDAWMAKAPRSIVARYLNER
jgi:hypothetical protein